MSFSASLFGQIMFIGGVVLILMGLDGVASATYSLAGSVLCGSSYLGLTLGEEVSRLSKYEKHKEQNS